MLFPEFLYQLSGRDQQVTWLDPRLIVNSGNGLALAVSAIAFTVPDNQVLIMTSFVGRADPGAGQACTRLIGLFRDLSGNLVPFTEAHFAVAADLNRDVLYQGQILVPPRVEIQVLGDFDAAVNNNNVLDRKSVM